MSDAFAIDCSLCTTPVVKVAHICASNTNIFIQATVYADKVTKNKLVCVYYFVNNNAHFTKSKIQEVCRSSRILTALVLKFAGVRWGAVALLTSYPTLNT